MYFLNGFSAAFRVTAEVQAATPSRFLGHWVALGLAVGEAIVEAASARRAEYWNFILLVGGLVGFYCPSAYKEETKQRREGGKGKGLAVHARGWDG